MNENITIIIPAYHVDDYLEQCIDSVVRQTFSMFRLIIIDDGSDDKCSEIADQWCVNDNRITVIHKMNGGLSEARNYGIDLNESEYITFVDSDDWLGENYLTSMYMAMVGEDAQICSSNSVIYYEESGKYKQTEKKPFIAGKEETLFKLYNQCEFPVDSTPKMYKSTIWDSIRFPVGKNYEDAFTTYKTIDKATRVIQILDSEYYYRIRENSIMTSPFSLGMVNINYAWKENYLFCLHNYPAVSDLARAFWLEHIPPLISQFPKQMTTEERKEKRKLKKEIIENLCFIVTKMPMKKVFYQIKAVMT